jgi:hypothetical protein
MIDGIVQIITFMERIYQEKFPNIVDIVLVSCKTGENIKKLRELLVDIAAARAMGIPKSYGFLEENVNAVRAELASHPHGPSALPPLITWQYVSNRASASASSGTNTAIGY